MSTNGKRSFFERLTGAITISDEDEKEMSGITEIAEETEEVGELAVDVYDSGDYIIIKAMVAGVRPDDLEISISRDMVTIKGRRVEERVTHEDYHLKELYWGEFSRTITLPAEVEPDEGEASEKFGLLTLKLPKIDRERKLRMKVKSF